MGLIEWLAGIKEPVKANNPLHGMQINLDKESQRRLKEMMRIIEAAGLLKMMLKVTPFLLVWQESGAAAKAFYLTTTDWNGICETANAVDKIRRNRIELICDLEILRTSGNEQYFWKVMKILHR